MLTQDFFSNEGQYSNMDWFLITVKATFFAYLFHKLIQSKHELDYKSFYARALARCFKFILLVLSTQDKPEKIDTTQGGTLMTVGPHKTSWEAFALGTHIKGSPPRFLASDYFSKIPLVAPLLQWFETITVKSEGRTQNLKNAVAKALEDGDCVALFPDGQFFREGALPPFMFDGAARFALDNYTPIKVVRIDGLWSLNNPLIPLFVRNSELWRFILSLFHLNNVRVTHCCDIDVPSKEESEQNPLTPEQRKMKINLINAILYSYYCHDKDLTKFQIDFITRSVSLEDKKEAWTLRQSLRQSELKLKKPDPAQIDTLQKEFDQAKRALHSKQYAMFKGMNQLTKSDRKEYNLSDFPTFDADGRLSVLGHNVNAS